ncbi:MAG: FkbM family methyltransferase [Phycisphaeraceae bacterium]|nr:FkbM family methyltransferase [Phycisphaeraceae bacterium]
MTEMTITLPTDPVMARLARKLRGFKITPTSRVTQTGHKLATVKVHHNGQSAQLVMRQGTTDMDLVRMIFNARCMYHLPKVVNPSIIFDCGANIGMTASYFAMTYPKATIYCFEPLPDNLELLHENIEQFGDRVKIMPFGLSQDVGSFTYNMSANPNSFGGGTFCKVGGDDDRALELSVRTVGDVIDELGIKQVDLFKLDTEGSEYAILKGTPPSIYRNAQALVGELHGVNDWDFCNLINDSHNIGIDKPYNRRCYEFVAIRKDL